MLRGKHFSGKPYGHQVFAERCVYSHGDQRTLTRYISQEVMYPMQVLDLSPAKGHFLAMPNRLAFYRKRAGLSQTELGERLNSGRSTITKLERGEIPLSDRWLDRIAPILECSRLDILGDQVPVVGKIGAGGSIVFEEIDDPDLIKRPTEVYGDIVGLEVVGDSMLPKFDPGDIVFISRNHDGVNPSDFGAICACRLRSGETFLKQLVKGSRAGLYTLRSYNAEDMEDVELEWATQIRSITPKRARHFS